MTNTNYCFNYPTPHIELITSYLSKYRCKYSLTVHNKI